MLRILIVDNERLMTKTLVDILRFKGYEVEGAHSSSEALEKVMHAPFDCVLSDIKMAEVSGVELCKAIKAVRRDLPVVLMTAYSVDELVKEGLQEGAVAVLSKPLDLRILLCFFSFLSKEPSITIVDDDPEFTKTLGDILQARGFAVTQITDPCDVVEKVGAKRQVVLLDLKLNHSDGLQVLQEIRQHYPCLPVVLVTGYRAEMAAAIQACLTTCAYTCLYKPLVIDELFQLLAEIQHQELGAILGQHQAAG